MPSGLTTAFVVILGRNRTIICNIENEIKVQIRNIIYKSRKYGCGKLRLPFKARLVTIL